MIKDYIYIKIYSQDNINLGNLKLELKDKCNNTIFKGVTDNFGRIKIPVCNNKLYKLIIYTNLMVIIVSLIARKGKTYCINIGNSKKKEHLITVILMDKNYSDIKIEGGQMILWQDTQSQ